MGLREHSLSLSLSLSLSIDLLFFISLISFNLLASVGVLFTRFRVAIAARADCTFSLSLSLADLLLWNREREKKETK